MLKRAVRVVLWCVAAVAVVGAVLLASLVPPGTPSSSGSLRFAGYLPLPKSGMLSVLDYMNVDGDRLFVAGLSAGSVSRISLDGQELPGGGAQGLLRGQPQTHGVVLDPVSHLGFVSRSGVNVVDVFDPETMTGVKSIAVANDPDGILYDPVDRLVYVASGDGKTGTLIDPATQTVAGTIALGGKPEFPAFDAETGQIYQNIESTGEVVAIDPGKRAITGRWKIDGCEGPSGMAVDEAQQRLWIACGSNSRAVVFDLATHGVLARLPVGRGPDTIAYDSDLHRAYTAGLAGVTTVLEQTSGTTYRVRDTVHTHFGAHTLAIDPATHRVYVGYASLLVAPRVAVFEAVR